MKEDGWDFLNEAEEAGERPRQLVSQFALPLRLAQRPHHHRESEESLDLLRRWKTLGNSSDLKEMRGTVRSSGQDKVVQGQLARGKGILGSENAVIRFRYVYTEFR
jgi:hypothetical protein